MAAACAVVSTAIGVEELGVEAEVQYLSAESAQMFANQLLRVLQDHRLRQKLGQAAQQHIVKNFSRQANLLRFKRIFNQAIQHKRLAERHNSA
jgi:glycosyltransferase involved in cell wall biosynthesis